ncbi:MAG: amino acid permease [Lentisphaerae bacterium RIFOXYA12_FULL_48_11]|nr:MAG: amino acid permease [Lentisphaerae bacterium RIFOXYA12_FULL_48_11]
MKSLLARKPMSKLLEDVESEEGKHTLARVLGPWNLTSLGVGGIIGAGIFVLTGQAAAQYAGPAIVLSFIFSAISCAFAGLCYAEFASMIPRAGSAYTYAYATMGEFFAWIIGWDLVLEYLFGASTVAVGWSGYVVSFLRDFGVIIPPQFTAATGTPLICLPDAGWVHLTEAVRGHISARGLDLSTLLQANAIINLPAVLIVGVVTTLLVVGIKESAHFNNLIVFVKVAVILLFIAFGFFFVKTENWVPFVPPNTGDFGHFGWSGVLRGAGVIFFAYIGFDAVSTAAQESKNPQKDMPISILGSLAICTVLYILVSLVMTGLVKYTHLAVPDPIAVAVDAAGKGLFWFRPFVKIGAIAGLSSVILVLLLGQTRVFYSMSHDGLLPPGFSKVHHKFKTPYVTTIVTGLVAAVISGTFRIGELGELVSIGTLLAFIIVCLGVLILRYRHPEIPRAFRTPFLPYVPVLGVIVCLAQMAGLPGITWLRLIIWMGIGLLIYFLYSRRHSHIRND